MDATTHDAPDNPHATPAEGARFAAFAAHLEAEGFSPATRACYASDWWNVSQRAHAATGRRFRLDRFGADEFSLQRAFLAARGSAPSTLNRRLAFLRRYSAFSAAREPALRDVAAGLSRVPFQAVERRTTKALTRTQEEKLRAAADALGVQDAAIVALLLGTGLRGTEAAALRRDDVVGPRAAPTAVRVQGPRAKTVLLAARAQARVAAFLAATRGEGLRGAARASSAPLFRGRDGAALGEEGIAAAVERAARSAGVEATPRTLRHTFGVRYLSEHRDDIEGLARALGHASLAAARAYRDEAGSSAPAIRAVRWSELEETSPATGVRRRSFAGDRIGAARTLIAPGASIARRERAHEQVSFVLSGRVTFTSARTAIEAGAGEFVHLPPGVACSITAAADRPALVLHVRSAPWRDAGAAP